MILPVFTTKKETNEVKRIKMKIWVESVMNVKVRDMEKKTREGRRISMRKDVVYFLQDLLGNNNSWLNLNMVRIER